MSETVTDDDLSVRTYLLIADITLEEIWEQCKYLGISPDDRMGDLDDGDYGYLSLVAANH